MPALQAAAAGIPDAMFDVQRVDRLNPVGFAAALLQDPAVLGVVAFAGTAPFIPSENLARLFIQLKPRSQRDVSAQAFIAEPAPVRAPAQRV